MVVYVFQLRKLSNQSGATGSCDTAASSAGRKRLIANQAAAVCDADVAGADSSSCFQAATQTLGLFIDLFGLCFSAEHATTFCSSEFCCLKR